LLKLQKLVSQLLQQICCLINGTVVYMDTRQDGFLQFCVKLSVQDLKEISINVLRMFSFHT